MTLGRLPAALALGRLPAALALGRLPAALALAAALALSGCATSGTSTNAEVKTQAKAETAAPRERAPRVSVAESRQSTAKRTGEIILMRGLADVFSRGMDTMAAKMRRRGLNAISTSHTRWEEIADDLIRREREGKVSHPVIIMGHSLGGNDASRMATHLGRNGVKVAYVVMFDPTEQGVVGANIGKVVNYYLPNGRNRVVRGRGFKGRLDNVVVTSMGLKHTTVEKSPALQERVIAHSLSLTRDTSAPARRQARRKPAAPSAPATQAAQAGAPAVARAPFVERGV